MFRNQQWKDGVFKMQQNRAHSTPEKQMPLVASGFLSGACYIRVSTDDQLEFSPDAQLRALKTYAQKNEITLSNQHIYIDEGISGRKADKRPEFMKMIAAAKRKPKPFDVILVHKFDRFARSREDSVVYKSLLKREADIKVVSITETIEDDKFSVILEAMLEAMAEYYSLNLAEEVKKGMTEKALRGGYQTAPPFGYKLIDRQLVVEPKEAELIRIIFHQFANKQMGFRAIADYVNELGVRTKHGNCFENRTIEYILNNPVYIGKVRWTPTGKTRRNYHNPDSIVADSDHQPIINMDLWERVQHALDVQKALYPKGQKPDAQLKSWLKGLVRCGNCGNTLVNSAGQYLQCNSYAKGACKISHCINTSALESLVLEQLKDIFQSELVIKVAPSAQDTTLLKEYHFLQERVIKLKQKQKRIKEAYLDGIDTLEEYKTNKMKLDAERKNAEEQLSDMVNRLPNRKAQAKTITKRVESVYALLTDNTIDMQMKYNAAHFLINKIIYHKPEKLITIELK